MYHLTAQEAALTRLHYQRCGYFSIQWGPVELRNNRVWNPEQNLQYPLVSEDLWNKHLGSKRNSGPEPMVVGDVQTKNARVKDTTRNDGDGASVRLAGMHATKLGNDLVINRLFVVAKEVLCTTGVVAPGDVRFSEFGGKGKGTGKTE